MRKYEGLLSEERENFLNMIEGMSYEEIIELNRSHPELIPKDDGEIKEIDMSPQELCERYGLVDMTSFFTKIGVKVEDL